MRVLARHEKAAVWHNEAYALGPLAAGPANVGVAISELQRCGTLHEQSQPTTLMMDGLDQAATHWSNGTQSINPALQWPRH